MRPVEQIAFAEFRRSFRWRSSGAPGARDFAWLSIFFVLSSFMLFLGLAAYEGTRHRFEQVLLGALPERDGLPASGPPIRLGIHIERPEALTPELLERLGIERPGLRGVPAREFDGQAGALTIPGFEAQSPSSADDVKPTGALPDSSECKRLKDAGVVWTCGKDGSMSDFRALALPRSSPIWQWIEAQAQAFPPGDGPEPSFVVAASRALFDRYFQYESYRKAVVGQTRVPCTLREAVHLLPTRSSGFPLMVLRVRESDERTESFHLARVIWVDSFPVDRIAMVIPLESYEPLLASEGRRKVSLHPELQGPGRRITRLALLNLDLAAAAEGERLGRSFRAMAQCLGAVTLGAVPSAAEPRQLDCTASVSNPADAMPVLPRLAQSTVDAVLTTRPEWALRSSDVALCARRAGLGAEIGPDPGRELPPGSPFKIGLAPEPTPVRWTSAGRLAMPCDLLNADDKAGRPPCEAGKLGEARLQGYRETFVYVRGDAAPGTARQSLDATVADLVNWKPPDGRLVFRLDPSYEGALTRFGVLSTIFETVSLPIGIGAALIFVFLTWVIMATTFVHRRAQYGLLMMNGMRGWGIAWLVSCQIALSAFAGGVVGLAAFAAVRGWVNGSLSASLIVRIARRLIGLDMPVFLDLPPATSLAVAWLGLTGVAIVVGNLTLAAQRVSTVRAPIMLLKS